MPTVTRLRYTSRTAAQIREDLIKAIPTLAPSWTSHGEDEPGIALVEMLAGVADGLHYYFDKQVLETYLPTVRLRKNAMSLSHLVGYRPRRTIAAQGTIRILTTQPLTYDVYVPARTQLTTRASVPIVTTEDVYLPQGFSGSKTVRAVQGELRTVTTSSTGGSDISITLPNRDPSEQLFRVSTYGQDWVEFRDSQPEDPNNLWYHYFEDFDSTTSIRFIRALGNVPMAGTPIDVQYILSQDITIASATPLNKPTLEAPEGLTESEQTAYEASVNNLKYETNILNGYRVKEPVADLRYTAPLSIKTKNRAISEIDYRFLARQIGGVKDIRVIPSDFYTRQVVVYVLTEDASEPSTELLERIRDYLDQRNDLTLDVVAEPAVLREFVCSLEINANLGFTDAAAVYQVREALNTHFRTTAFNFGRTLRLGEIYAIANGVQSVEYVNVTALHWADDTESVGSLETGDAITVPWINANLTVSPVTE
jgi:hypothetical protein